MNSLSFCLFGIIFLSPSFLKDSFAGRVFLVHSFFSFSNLNVSSHSLLSWKISAEKSADSLWGFPHMRKILFSCCLEILPFSLILDVFILKCLWKDHLGLKFQGDLLTWWIWISKFLPSFGKFPAIISLNKISGSFSLYFLSWTTIIHSFF